MHCFSVVELVVSNSSKLCGSPKLFSPPPAPTHLLGESGAGMGGGASGMAIALGHKKANSGLPPSARVWSFQRKPAEHSPLLRAHQYWLGNPSKAKTTSCRQGHLLTALQERPRNKKPKK